MIDPLGTYHDPALSNVVQIQQEFAHEERRVLETWAAYQAADRTRTTRGIDFGKALYKLRNKYATPGRRGGFKAVLERTGINHDTAYRWIARYEESTGEREPSPTSDKVEGRGQALRARRRGGVLGVEVFEPDDPPYEPEHNAGIAEKALTLLITLLQDGRDWSGHVGQLCKLRDLLNKQLAKRATIIDGTLLPNRGRG
jgi:hypothetical protein